MKKATKCLLPEQTLQEHYLELQQINRLHISKGDNDYNEIEFSLASIEVLNSKNHTKHGSIECQPM